MFVNRMQHQHMYENPSQDSGRETVAVEMNNFSEADNGVVSPEVVYVGVKLKGKDYMCCSVFNIMFCNCLFLGFAALICSLKARSKMNEGDMVKAQKYSRRACRTNTVAVIVTSAALTVFLVFYCGEVFNDGVILHNLPGASSASSADTSFSSIDLSFDTERQKSKPRNYYDQRRHNSNPSGSNINRSPQRPSYSGVRWKG